MPWRSTNSATAPEDPSRGAGTDVSDDTLLLAHGHSTPGTVHANTALGDPFNTRVRSNARGEVWKELQKQAPPSNQSSEPSSLIPPDVMRVLQKSQNERDAESGHQSSLTIMSNGKTQTFDFSGMNYEDKITAAADAVEIISGHCPLRRPPQPFFPDGQCPSTVNEVYHLYCKMARYALKFKTAQERGLHIMEFFPLMLNAFNNLTTRPNIGTFFFNIKTSILLSDPQLGDPEDPRSDFFVNYFGEVAVAQIAAVYQRKTGLPHNDPLLMNAALGIASMLLQAFLEIERFTNANYTYFMLRKKMPNGNWVNVTSEPKGDSIELHPIFDDFKKMNFTIDYSPGGPALPPRIRFRDVSMPDRITGRENNDKTKECSEDELSFYKEAEEATERNAAELLAELEEEEAASKADAMRKAARNRATKLRKKKKKSGVCNAVAYQPYNPQLDSIAENEMHVQAEDEPARYEVGEVGEAGEAGEVPESGAEVVADVTEVFNLSDIGSALTRKDDDVATSVATALMCVICMSEEKSVACVPCGHKCLCEGCGNQETTKDKCPICRESIAMFMRVFE